MDGTMQKFWCDPILFAVGSVAFIKSKARWAFGGLWWTQTLTRSEENTSRNCENVCLPWANYFSILHVNKRW